MGAREGADGLMPQTIRLLDGWQGEGATIRVDADEVADGIALLLEIETPLDVDPHGAELELGTLRLTTRAPDLSVKLSLAVGLDEAVELARAICTQLGVEHAIAPTAASGDSLSAMGQMSQAIRRTLERYAPTLAGLPDDVLTDLAMIVSAYAGDLRDERERRRAAT
jgi:hypothetical protein